MVDVLDLPGAEATWDQRARETAGGVGRALSEVDPANRYVENVARCKSGTDDLDRWSTW